MKIDHWVPIGLLGANAAFQRAARAYAEEYAELAVAAERERCARVCEWMVDPEIPEIEDEALLHAARRIRGTW
jgi:hypothetical protein